MLCLLNASGQGHTHAHTVRDTWHQPHLCTNSQLCIQMRLFVGHCRLLGLSGRPAQSIQLPKANDRLNRKINMSTRSVFFWRVGGVGVASGCQILHVEYAMPANFRFSVSQVMHSEKRFAKKRDSFRPRITHDVANAMI